ncbi:serine hydrolase [Nonomuraea guangzhouensis]|uniref:Serine hydrolase n=1 Tax=Nonomuraea guangzhouensis TaxID=1291555 RepID=A0ABW4G0C8_9ACTN|nr:serine hydrolase [Nonomuraea guangzhouensis]
MVAGRGVGGYFRVVMAGLLLVPLAFWPLPEREPVQRPVVLHQRAAMQPQLQALVEVSVPVKTPRKKSKPDPPIGAKKITKRLDRYLAGRPGPVTAMVKDLTTGRLYRYHRNERMITASTAKVQILMALLLKTPWHKLSKATRRDADLMIRYSDNHAADRLWLRVGGAAGFTKAGRKYGLRHTQGVPGSCVDLYCWGITRTSAEDQVRLMKALVSAKSPLRAKDRAQVLKLMGGVIDGQDWGVSAARCKGDRVALKNGWLKHVSTKRWAIISVGLIRGHGHDYAVAVLTENNADTGQGIATVEGVTERIMKSFWSCRT